jgi:hypothetical protein
MNPGINPRWSAPMRRGAGNKKAEGRTTRKPLLLMRATSGREDFFEATLIEGLEDEREQEQEEQIERMGRVGL